MEFAQSEDMALICDGSVRSGKTTIMALTFVLWAMNNYDHTNFAICGKTVQAAERNILKPLMEVDGLSSDTRSTMLTTYIFCDADRNEFALNVISTTKVFDLNMELTNGLFDHSKLDSNNPDAGIWETSKAVLRK